MLATTLSPISMGTAAAHASPSHSAPARIAPSAAQRADVVPAWVRNLDLMLCQLAAARDRLVLPLSHASRLFHDARGWTPFGFSQPDDWTHERLGRSASWLRRLASVDRAIQKHPALSTALAGTDGKRPIGTAALLEIASICHVLPPSESDVAAAQDPVQAWIQRARELSLAELRVLVRSIRSALAAASPTGEPATRAHAVEQQARMAPEAGCVAAERALCDANAFPADTDEPRSQVRLEAPADVLEAFEQTLDLHRAVIGRESGVASFVEALCAEGASGSFPFDVAVNPVRAGAAAAPLPKRSAWQHLELAEGMAGTVVSLDTSALRRAASTLRRFAAIEQALQPCAEPPSPARLRLLAAQLADLVALENELEIRIGELLAELDVKRAWNVLHFTSAAHYAEERLRMSRTTARDRIDAARGLRRLPIIERAYESGRIGLEKVLLLLRLSGREPMDAAIQEEWVVRAERATLKRCRDEYRALRHAKALQKSDPGRGQPTTVRPLDDTAWRESIRRTPGHARAFVLDIGCRVLERENARRWCPVVCKHVRLPEELAHSFAASIDAARRALGQEAARFGCLSPADEARLRPSVRIARLFAGKPTGVPAWLGLLALLEEYVLVWDASEAMPDRRREAIHERDGYRCAGPACSQRSSLEAHHLRYRSNGGSNESDNLLTVCAFHHRLGEHGVFATVTGLAPDQVVWGLGRPELRTWYHNELRM